MSHSDRRADNDNGTATVPENGARTDVTDSDATRQELICVAEDLDQATVDPDAYDTAENRLLQLLSDVRRARKQAHAGGDA